MAPEHRPAGHPKESKASEAGEGGVFAQFVPYAIGLLVISIAILLLLPKWQPAPSTVEFVDAKVVQASKDQTIVEATLSWSAPHTGNCYLANDVRPAGAAKGEPETAEWSAAHLIRYNLRNGQPQVEYWVNAEVLKARKSTRTYTYIIQNPPAGTSQLDVYSDLKCDDALLASAKSTVAYQAA